MGKVPPFRELIAEATTSAVHLETRDAYTPDDPQYLDWLAGKPIPEPALPDWHALVRAHVARGVRFRRARVVSEPLAPFIRFEHFITGATNVAADEEVRWLPCRGVESARQAASDSDIRAWCEICLVPDQAVDLIAASRAADSMYQEWWRLHRTGMRRLQETRGTLYERTRVFKVYCSTVVPGFLQTPGYATALMSAITAFQGTPDDVAEAVRARVTRNRILASESRRFTILVEESVLRYRVGGSEVMLAQLGNLLSVTALPSAPAHPQQSCQR